MKHLIGLTCVIKLIEKVFEDQLIEKIYKETLTTTTKVAKELEKRCEVLVKNY